MKEPVIVLPIKKQWFDMIFSGEKLEEYREIKPYYINRLCKLFGVKEEELKKKLSGSGSLPIEVKFQNGYGKNVPMFSAKCTVSIKCGETKWGAQEGREYFNFAVHKPFFKISMPEGRTDSLDEITPGDILKIYDKNQKFVDTLCVESVYSGTIAGKSISYDTKTAYYFIDGISVKKIN